MQAVKIVVWQEDDAWIGYLQDYPDYWTQGDSLDDLKEHLKDLHADLAAELISPALDELRIWSCHETRRPHQDNPNTGVSQPVPRHREIKENLARHIIRMLRNEPESQGRLNS